MPVTPFWTALADSIPWRVVATARRMWTGAAGALWSGLLWFVSMGLMALAEGMDGFTSTHCSCSRLNGVIHMTNLQQMQHLFLWLSLRSSFCSSMSASGMAWMSLCCISNVMAASLPSPICTWQVSWHILSVSSSIDLSDFFLISSSSYTQTQEKSSSSKVLSR